MREDRKDLDNSTAERKLTNLPLKNQLLIYIVIYLFVSGASQVINAGDAPPKHNFDTLNQELLVTKGMPNTSHFLMMERSTEFNELLESILEEFKLILR